MVRLIMGEKGTGKTKKLIELINASAAEENGNVVCIEAKSTMTFDIHYHVRLISADEYQITTYEGLRGFVSGLCRQLRYFPHLHRQPLQDRRRRLQSGGGRLPGLAQPLQQQPRRQVHRFGLRRPRPCDRRNAEVPVTPKPQRETASCRPPFFISVHRHCRCPAGGTAPSFRRCPSRSRTIRP